MIIEIAEKADLLRRILIASVWVFHGLGNKLLAWSPRHLQIVHAMPGVLGKSASEVLSLVGVGEVAMAIWVLSGSRRAECAIAQTATLLTMNVMELIWARQFLIWPAALLPVNCLFLVLVWSNTRPVEVAR